MRALASALRRWAAIGVFIAFGWLWETGDAALAPLESRFTDAALAPLEEES